MLPRVIGRCRAANDFGCCECLTRPLHIGDCDDRYIKGFQIADQAENLHAGSGHVRLGYVQFFRQRA
jgi:hypothetical protein